MSKNSKVVEPAGQHRWRILLGGFLLSLMGGMSYAWGSFVVPLVDDWGWTALQATLPLTTLIVVFAMTMIPAGWIQDRFGPRKVAMAGSLLFLVGYGLSALVRVIPSPLWLALTYGGLVGIACGLTYSCIAPTARKWYADRPGFAVSTAVMGFGLAAVVFAPLKKVLIRAVSVDGTLLALGLFVTGVAVIGARLVRNPPADYSVEPALRKASAGPALKKDATPGEFVRTPAFYILWFALAAVIGGGLTAIGLLTAFGEIHLGLSPGEAALTISFFSLINGLGRPLAGWLADRVGTLRVMIVAYCFQAAVFLLLPWIATNHLILIACALLMGAGYAVTFALFPVVVATGTGTKHLGVNYGMVFSAFGMGAVTGLLGSWLYDVTASFTPAFLLAGITTVIGLILLAVLRAKYPAGGSV